MIGVVIITHSRLAHELRNAAEMILGELEAVEPISIDRDMSVSLAKETLINALSRVDSGGDGTIILTDLFGGTPTNISAEFLRPGHVEILTGVNLPMLIKCVGARSGQSVDDLAIMLKDYARNAIMRPAELLRSVEA
ncbi:MAG: PTS sugar transporter subunit IIA [Deltaproteobacteria bacterium]|jgi:PTS system mannose-specific IIA component|nr:PTS sugar transporter subunit IIA [Deltaproteobacteria bacterium]MCW8892399.1 PTS sugar transporter subunit IIA [Deltaproteobacteria bacterium]MCW9050157.1 PTS sugar transporter subunit IIA [Deltaproteobacteria bacterium]